MSGPIPPPRVALIAGSLGLGGAEKQLVYAARALREAGAVVEVLSLTRGDHHEAELQALGFRPRWIGRRASPAARLGALTRALWQFRPHVVAACHFFTNLYAAIGGGGAGAAATGALRGDGRYERARHGRWTPFLFRYPRDLIANSSLARETAITMGAAPGRIHVVPNVIDIAGFDAGAGGPAPGMPEAPFVAAVGTLLPVKRFDRFLRALALARKCRPRLAGVIVGGGPEEAALRRLAAELGLGPEAVVFAGPRDDIAAILSRAAAFALTSDHEGFPNALLEAMTARLPLVATPAGEAPALVEDGVTGFLVPFDAPELLADRLVRLTEDGELAGRLGAGARRRIEQSYSWPALGPRLLSVFRSVAAAQRRFEAVRVLERV